jgi:hypothetical protein
MRNTIAAVLVLTVAGSWAVYSQPAIPPLPAPAPAKTYPILPPIEFDHYYEGDLTINMVNTQEELFAACGMEPNRFLLACSTHTRTACLITMVKDEVMRSKGWTTGLLLRHEIGHCNGWPGDHPGERSIMQSSKYLAPAHERPIPKNVVRR